MMFGTFALEQADGAILAHTTRAAGRLLKKGTVLDPPALAALRSAGMRTVVAAKLEPGDVAEDSAARRLGEALASAALSPTRAATGRVNLTAQAAGLLRVDGARVAAINAVTEAVTLATLPDAVPVGAGDIVATLKIIPFAVPQSPLASALAEAALAPAVSLHPWHPLRVGLVLTELSHLKPSVFEATIVATRGRVEALTGTLLPPLRCAHQADPIAAAFASLLGQGAEMLLLAGASAVVDRGDVGPSGIVAAGGEVVHVGMPVDPGNLICLGRIGAVPAVVLPGCARSPALNGIDHVLRRLFAGLPCTGAHLAEMGVGGLLKDIPARPLRRARASPPSEAELREEGPPPVPRVAAIVLAAGHSRRMAPRHKLLVPDASGVPMVARVVDACLASGAGPVIVVTGHRADEVVACLGARPVRIVFAAAYAAGLSASLRAGLAAVPPGCGAALVALADMPMVTGAMMARLLASYQPSEGRLIVAASHGGKIGNPVLWDRGYFAAIAALTGDRGARGLLDEHAGAITLVELGEAALRDFDTPESLAELVA